MKTEYLALGRENFIIAITKHIGSARKIFNHINERKKLCTYKLKLLETVKRSLLRNFYLMPDDNVLEIIFLLVKNI